MEESTILWCFWWPAPISASFLGHASLGGTCFEEKKRWAGLGDWREITAMSTEVTACLGRGYGKESVQRPLQLMACRENWCARKRKEVCRGEFGEADLRKSNRRVFSQEIYLLDQEGNKLSR